MQSDRNSGWKSSELACDIAVHGRRCRHRCRSAAAASSISPPLYPVVVPPKRSSARAEATPPRLRLQSAPGVPWRLDPPHCVACIDVPALGPAGTPRSCRPASGGREQAEPLHTVGRDAATVSTLPCRDPKKCPDGWIPLVVAENKLNNEEVLARLQEGSKDAPAWVMNYGRCDEWACSQSGQPANVGSHGCSGCLFWAAACCWSLRRLQTGTKQVARSLFGVQMAAQAHPDIACMCLLERRRCSRQPPTHTCHAHRHLCCAVLCFAACGACRSCRAPWPACWSASCCPALQSIPASCASRQVRCCSACRWHFALPALPRGCRV